MSSPYKKTEKHLPFMLDLILHTALECGAVQQYRPPPSLYNIP